MVFPLSAIPPAQPELEKHGECEALGLCLTDLWQKHCIINRILVSECPMKGLLDGEVALQPSNRSASSRDAPDGAGAAPAKKRRQR